MSSLSFTKLFSSITASSIWQESDQTRLVWITMLALGDPLGRVHASIPGLAHLARVSIADAEKALHTFLTADPYSRSKEHDGRRIEVIADGWQLLNYKMYREKRDPDARKEQNRIHAAKHRDKSKQIVSQVSHSKPTSATVSHESAQEEVEEEVEGYKATTNTLASSSNELPAAPRKLVCTLPLNQGDHQVFEDDVQQWQALYPAIDVRQELRNTKGWLIGNPKLRKTKTGINRFINSWLSRAQNEAKPSGGGNGRNQTKTSGNFDAARGAFAILAEAERNSCIADEMQPQEGLGDESGDLSHLRTGSIEL